MTGIVASVVEGYHKFMAEHGDPRTKDWFLMSSPVPMVALLAVYLLGCTWLGPRLMRHREPFKLRKTLVVYNFLVTVGSAWLFVEGLDAAWLHYSFKCEPVDYSDNPKALRVARLVWVYFMTKVVELLDTVFFVMRKKHNQVSFLHLYHHTMTMVCAWAGARFLPGGHGTLLGQINCLVHVVMYFYYMVSAMGPRFQRYLGWKRYLTVMQLVQFCILLVHDVQVLFRECDYPKSVVLILAFNVSLMLYMFSRFYYRSYVVQAPAAKRPAQRRSAKSNGVGKQSDVNDNKLKLKTI